LRQENIFLFALATSPFKVMQPVTFQTKLKRKLETQLSSSMFYNKSKVFDNIATNTRINLVTPINN